MLASYIDGNNWGYIDDDGNHRVCAGGMTAVPIGFDDDREEITQFIAFSRWHISEQKLNSEDCAEYALKFYDTLIRKGNNILNIDLMYDIVVKVSCDVLHDPHKANVKDITPEECSIIWRVIHTYILNFKPRYQYSIMYRTAIYKIRSSVAECFEKRLMN